MKNIVCSLLIGLFLISCDDGDIIVTSFDFEDASLENCQGDDIYVFFKINTLAAESISLAINTSQTLFLASGTTTYQISNSTNRVNYRKYSESITANYFCSSIPPTSPEVTVNYLSSSGTATLITTAVLDDNDNLEEAENQELDSDNDGLPNYYDFDDDGDNVPTAIELGPNPDEPQDSDGDGTPDYLDIDDDNDGVLTRNEDANMDLDPTNDVNGTQGLPDYLDDSITEETIIAMFREHRYTINSDVQVFITDLVLEGEGETITQESLDLGEIIDVLSDEIPVTPNFPN